MWMNKNYMQAEIEDHQLLIFTQSVDLINVKVIDFKTQKVPHD